MTAMWPFSGYPIAAPDALYLSSAPSLSSLTTTDITQTGARHSLTISNAAAGTLYLAVYPSAAPTPTWDRVTGWSGSPAYTDTDASPTTSGAHTFVPDASGLTAGTQLVPWAVWYDGTTTVGPAQGTTFETLAAGITGTLSATESGADTAIIVGGNILAGYLSAQESGSDTAAASGAVVVSGAMAASEAGADGFAASGSIGAADVIGSFAALESGADTISVSGVVLVAGVLAAAEAGSDTMQTTTGEGYPSSVTITVPAGRLLSAASGRTITLRPR